MEKDIIFKKNFCPSLFISFLPTFLSPFSFSLPLSLPLSFTHRAYRNHGYLYSPSPRAGFSSHFFVFCSLGRKYDWSKKSEKRGRKIWEGKRNFLGRKKDEVERRERMNRGENDGQEKNISILYFQKIFFFFQLFSNSFLTSTISFLPDSLSLKFFFSNHFLEFVFPLSFPHWKIIAPSSC